MANFGELALINILKNIITNTSCSRNKDYMLGILADDVA
jgi:hypothetical protein